MSDWLAILGGVLSTPFISIFLLQLLALAVFSRHGLLVVVLSLPILAADFVVSGHPCGGWKVLAEHFGQHEEYHLLYNLALLLPGFSLVAYYFEHSGFDARLAKYIKTDHALMWAVFVLSIALDNIAAAMIGGVLVRARYGKEHAPFSLLVGVVGASNLGGAPSFIGDTTTVMLYLSGVSAVSLAQGFVPAIVAQIVLGQWAARHGAEPLPIKPNRPTPVKWNLFCPLLGIPGLVAGNLLYDQPGLGLFAGVIAGCIIGREHFRWQELHLTGKTMQGMYFLVLLVAGAGMLPTEALQPVLDRLTAGETTFGIGVLSAFFNNIPLVKLTLSIGGFDWPLMAYAVGFGGSAMWFGSSAGVAMVGMFETLGNTKKWLLGGFWVVLAAYTAGYVAYLLIFAFAVPTVMEVLGYLQVFVGATIASLVLFAAGTLFYYGLAKLGLLWMPNGSCLKSLLSDIKKEWY